MLLESGSAKNGHRLGNPPIEGVIWYSRPVKVFDKLMGGSMMGRQGSTISEWAKCIAELRQKLQMTQTQLAERVGVTAMTVSRWERGLVEPTAGGYIALGNLANPRQAWYFWRRAGLNEERVRKARAGAGRR